MGRIERDDDSCVTYRSESTVVNRRGQPASWGWVTALLKAARADGKPTDEQLKKRPLWQEDECCPECCDIKCKQKFSLLNRRHHCRACGFIFCGKHSSSNLDIDDLGYKNARVCLFCHALLCLDEESIEPDTLQERASMYLFKTKRKKSPLECLTPTAEERREEQRRSILEHPSHRRATITPTSDESRRRSVYEHRRSLVSPTEEKRRSVYEHRRSIITPSAEERRAERRSMFEQRTSILVR